MAKDRTESKYVTVAPGVELHVLEKGEGKPLVFIPGLTFSGEIFKNQLEYFSSKYRVIAIDPRGQGYSAKTVDGNDYLTHGRDVAGLIDACTTSYLPNALQSAAKKEELTAASPFFSMVGTTF